MPVHPDERLTEACHSCRKHEWSKCERVFEGRSCFERRMLPDRTEEWRKVATNRRHRIAELEGENAILRVALEAAKELRVGAPESEVTTVFDTAIRGLEMNKS